MNGNFIKLSDNPKLSFLDLKPKTFFNSTKNNGKKKLFNIKNLSSVNFYKHSA